MLSWWERAVFHPKNVLEKFTISRKRLVKYIWMWSILGHVVFMQVNVFTLKAMQKRHRSFSLCDGGVPALFLAFVSTRCLNLFKWQLDKSHGLSQPVCLTGNWVLAKLSRQPCKLVFAGLRFWMLGLYLEGMFLLKVSLNVWPFLLCLQAILTSSGACQTSSSLPSRRVCSK